MNVSELYDLALWLKDRTQEASGPYKQLTAALQHNATQADKQPVEDKLTRLVSVLEQMELQVLTNEQMRLLELMDVARVLGPAGASNVRNTITKSTFDPATAHQEIQEMHQRIGDAQKKASDIIQALDAVDVPFEEPGIETGQVLIRVEFRRDAAIVNAASWKDWSAKWNDIVRGVALACDENPDDTVVVGATTGSIIFELGGSYLFVRVLSGIARSVIGVAKDVYELLHIREDLRTKKLLNDKLENELTSEAERVKSDGAKRIVEEIKQIHGVKATGEPGNALEKAIARYIEFHEKGGEVDFVAPEEGDGEEAGIDEATKAVIGEVRALIEDYRSEKDELKLIEDGTGGDNGNQAEAAS